MSEYTFYVLVEGGLAPVVVDLQASQDGNRGVYSYAGRQLETKRELKLGDQISKRIIEDIDERFDTRNVIFYCEEENLLINVAHKDYYTITPED